MENHQLIAVIAGRRAARALAKKFKTLTELARANEADIGQIRGVGVIAAQKITAALLLAARLNQEAGMQSPDFGNVEISAAQKKLVESDQIENLRTPRKFLD